MTRYLPSQLSFKIDFIIINELYCDRFNYGIDIWNYFITLKVAESVRLQAELHEKEKTILRQQRKRCQKVYKDLDTLRTKMNEAQGK